MRGRKKWGIAAVLIATALTACQKDSGGPAENTRDFFRNLRSGRAEAGFRLLSAETQRLLQEKGRQFTTATGRTKKLNEADLLFDIAGIRLVDKIERVEVAQGDASSAEVHVHTKNGKPLKMRAVKEDSGWRLDLVKELTLAFSHTSSNAETKPDSKI